jgi:hypothetical protein
MTTRRTDDELLGLLDEPGEWSARGQGGTVLFDAGNLRTALGKAMSLGGQALALVRGQDEIIVFAGQLERVAEAIREADRRGPL